MLKFQSFKMTDSAGINALLETRRLAKGASVFVAATGDIIIPYEDGEPMNTAQFINELYEKRNDAQAELRVVEHAQGILDILINNAETRLNEAEANYEAGKGGKAKETTALATVRDRAQNSVDQLLNQRNTNENEIMRLKLNIEQYEKAAEELMA